jgi:hypothetical protein
MIIPFLFITPFFMLFGNRGKLKDSFSPALFFCSWQNQQPLLNDILHSPSFPRGFLMIYFRLYFVTPPLAEAKGISFPSLLFSTCNNQYTATILQTKKDAQTKKTQKKKKK